MKPYSEVVEVLLGSRGISRKFARAVGALEVGCHGYIVNKPRRLPVNISGVEGQAELRASSAIERAAVLAEFARHSGGHDDIRVSDDGAIVTLRDCNTGDAAVLMLKARSCSSVERVPFILSSVAQKLGAVIVEDTLAVTTIRGSCDAIAPISAFALDTAVHITNMLHPPALRITTADAGGGCVNITTEDDTLHGTVNLTEGRMSFSAGAVSDVVPNPIAVVADIIDLATVLTVDKHATSAGLV